MVYEIVLYIIQGSLEGNPLLLKLFYYSNYLPSIYYLISSINSITVLRFLYLPSFVSFDATGDDSPKP